MLLGNGNARSGSDDDDDDDDDACCNPRLVGAPLLGDTIDHAEAGDKADNKQQKPIIVITDDSNETLMIL